MRNRREVSLFVIPELRKEKFSKRRECLIYSNAVEQTS